MPAPSEIMAVMPRKKKQLRQMEEIKRQQATSTGTPPSNPLEESREWIKKQMFRVKPYKKLIDALDTGGLQRKR